MSSKVTYHQQISFCGKPRCHKCKIGVGHGPYWYAYKMVNGRTIRTYIGKTLPPDVQPEQVQTWIAGRPAREDDPAVLRVSMLGRFELERRLGRNWQAVDEGPWRHQRQRTLLALLLNSPGRKLGREQIMEALWPELDPETAAARLDRAVHALRRVLEPSLPRLATSRLLRTEHEGLALADQREIWVDSDAFEALLARAHDEQRSPAEREQLLEEAAALYVSDLLPEMQDASWVVVRRDMLRRQWMGLLLELADLRLARQAYAAMIEPLDRLLASDDTNEAAVQRLMVALTALGRRAEAMRAYHRLAEALERTYNITPLEETRRLYEEARSGGSGARPPAYMAVLAALASETGGAQERRESRPRVQIGRVHQSPLIGREAELETLHHVLDFCEQQRRARFGNRRRALVSLLEAPREPQSVLLAGEAGIGKTRLAEELAREAQQRGWAIAWSRAYAQESGVPYRPWSEVLRNAQDRGFWQISEISGRPLLYQPLSVLLPELNALPRVEFPNPLSPEDEQRRLWEAMLELLTLISERAPLLVVLDDIHWADASSCELLAYVVRHLPQRAMMLIATYRDTELSADHVLRMLLPHLQREQVALRLEIEPLSDEQIAALVSYLPEPLVRYIQEKAGGNPFFAEELARMLASSADGGSDLRARGQLLEQPQKVVLPDTIAAVLDLRLSRLSEACRRLLSNASVLEGTFEFGEMLQMERAGGGNIDEGRLLDLLEEALQEGVLVEEGAGTRISYHFWHPLLGMHLYNRLSGARRISLHRRAAAVMQTKYAGREAEGAATITNHLVRSDGDAQAIAHYAELAGDHAYELSAYGQAEHYYRLAIQYLQQARRTPVASWTIEERLQLAALYELLAYCLRMQGKPEEARQFYEQLLELRNPQALRRSLSEAEALYEAQYEAMVWVEIGWTWYDTNNSGRALECCRRGAAILREASIATSPAWADMHRLQSSIAWKSGNYSAALEEAQRSLDFLQEILGAAEGKRLSARPLKPTHIARALAGDPIELAKIYRLLGSIANSVGNTKDALTNLNMALRIFEQYNCYQDMATVCCNIGHAYLNTAQYKLAQSTLRRALSQTERVGEGLLKAVILSNLGLSAARLGNLAEAEKYLRQSIELAEGKSEKVYSCLWNAFLASILQSRMKSAEAVALIRKAFSLAMSLKLTPFLGFALVVLGSMRLTQGLVELPMTPPSSARKSAGSSRAGQRKSDNSSNSSHALIRARAILERALALKELEADIRLEGMLVLAQTRFLLGEVEEARHLALAIGATSNHHKSAWESARAQALLATILLAEGQGQEADQALSEALQRCVAHGMRLEQGRALYLYGLTLLRQRRENDGDRQRALDYLREAWRLFGECQAALEAQAAGRLLTLYGAGG